MPTDAGAPAGTGQPPAPRPGQSQDMSEVSSAVNPPGTDQLIPHATSGQPTGPYGGQLLVESRGCSWGLGFGSPARTCLPMSRRGFPTYATVTRATLRPPSTPRSHPLGSRDATTQTSNVGFVSWHCLLLWQTFLLFKTRASRTCSSSFAMFSFPLDFSRNHF